MGLFGGSSKSSSSATDKRLVTGEGSNGISADSSTVNFLTNLEANQTDNSSQLWFNSQDNNSKTSWANNQTDSSTSNVNVTDSGIVARALDSIDLSNATRGQGFSELLGAGQSILEKSSNSLGNGFSGLVDAAKSIFNQGTNSQSQGLKSLVDSGQSMFETANSSQTSIFRDLIDAGKSLIGQTQQSVSDAYQTATAEKSGAMDNKTLMVLGIAAIAGIAIVFRGKQ